MSHVHFRATVAALATMVLAGAGLAADSLYIHGVVRNQQSQAISGAVVTATFGGTGGGGTARTVRDTVDASGNYVIRTVSATGASANVVQLAASAAGYQTSNQVGAIVAPNDGAMDTIAQNFTLTAGTTTAGDSLYVSGSVDNAAGDAIAGAKVRISILTMDGVQVDSALTNASGSYSIATINANAGRSVTFVVSAAGYNNGNAQSTVQNPDDGTVDRITRDFTLQSLVVDTLIVTGRVTDSANGTGLVGAEVIYSFSSGGMMGGTVYDTVISGAGGNFSESKVVTFMPTNVSWRVNMTGYAGKDGQVVQTNDSAKVGNVALVALDANDSLVYTVSGRVSDSLTTLAVRNTDVIVKVMRGTTVIVDDTVTTTNQGQYTLSSSKVAYVAGTLTVTVSVSQTGYAPWTTTASVPSSTADIIINARLQATVGVLRAMSVRAMAPAAQSRTFSLDGRAVGSSAQASVRSSANQVTVRQSAAGTQKYVSAH